MPVTSRRTSKLLAAKGSANGTTRSRPKQASGNGSANSMGHAAESSEPVNKNSRLKRNDKHSSQLTSAQDSEELEHAFQSSPPESALKKRKSTVQSQSGEPEPAQKKRKSTNKGTLLLPVALYKPEEHNALHSNTEAASVEQSSDTVPNDEALTKKRVPSEATGAVVNKKPTNQTVPVWWFRSPNDLPFPIPELTAFEFTFYDALHHVVSVGNLIHNLQSLPNGEWQATAGPGPVRDRKQKIKKLISTDPRTKDIGDLRLLRYFEMTMGDWSDGDKYMPLRMHAPSMKMISELLPVNEAKSFDGIDPKPVPPYKKMALSIFRLAILRIFGVGHPELITKLAAATTCFEVIEIVTSHTPAGKKSIARSVYGQLMIPCRSVQKIVTAVYALGEKLSFSDEKDRKTFAEVQRIIATYSIPCMGKGGILTWLFGCDLAAFGYCAEATWEDLANKMGIVALLAGKPDEVFTAELRTAYEKKEKKGRGGGGGGGPMKGLKYVIQMADSITEDVDPAKRAVEVGYKVLMWKEPFIAACVSVVAMLNTRFEEDFKELGLKDGLLPRDMEHFLCKIARMENRAEFEFSKK